MPTLEPLRADHADALLAFEQENRAYFARTVPDRGDVFFTPAGFAERLRSLLAEQHARACRFHVVLGEEGNLIGRVNLIDVADGSAELGYRIGEQAAGRGVATAAVAQVCHLAATDYGLTSLTAATTLDNPASMRVLARNGFTRVEEAIVGGRPGVRFLRRPLRQRG
ncbi:MULTISPECIES: GNAT family N-acetyltransferase [Streptomyces]|uniref:GNAT family N-acetyltransferase n=1 Tax=Streptomyces koelreuteriae TaxID=2838015 RepID=A0ABX8FVT2_9ACTN|nr:MULTISPECIES: GNAT family N-acetyltransferase [Streptomyces]QWB25110.1 GNAT family N-acetyltransferase [Streptomyces koelreuteriae]UUA08143.1 GNAT family N-acetyltransferase [Streptomyces koelreuteriae]UUA15750.1 GNAT family N-acetyltransferase [Streptomyces sp. CRCS-T-1]